jgi:hypothetical protein
MPLKALVKPAMVSEHGRPFGFRRMGGQHQLDLHLRQGRGNLLRVPAAIFQLAQSVTPKCRQRIGSGLGFDSPAKLVSRVLLGHSQQLESNRVGLGQVHILQRWVDTGEFSIGQGQASSQLGRPGLLEDMCQGPQDPGPLLIQALFVQRQDTFDDHVFGHPLRECMRVRDESNTESAVRASAQPSCPSRFSR